MQSAGLTGKVNEHNCNFTSWSKPKMSNPLSCLPLVLWLVIFKLSFVTQPPFSSCTEQRGHPRMERGDVGHLLDLVLPPKGAFVELQFRG